jgi:hypothetical protein
MTHRQRLQWLAERGFVAEDRGIVHATLGTCTRIDGTRLGIEETFWLAARDGQSLLWTSSDPPISWEELQAWITEKPEVKKPLAAQRNLFGDDE